jgi:2,3,4,5-tetrahydropyridine-2,6-dicarboxylate N-succinyltransferase
MNISEGFIRRPVATSLLMAAIGFIGLVAIPFLPVAALPQVDFPTIQVSATLQGASAETMAASVASPLERQFGQIPGITQLTSTSALNSTSITIQFELNRNIDAAAQDVQAAITAASRTLPQTMTTPPSYRKVNPADSPILTLSAQSDTLPLISVDDYADNFIAQQISQVRGVAQVQIWGEQKPAIRIQDDPAKLASAGLTLEDVRPMLVSSTTIASKGTVNTAETTFTIAANDQIIEAGPFEYVDKLPLKHGYEAAGVRVVPGASARFGAYLAPGVVMMPCYVNIGAYVDTGTLIDTWATVGSCAQIGKNVHLSGGVGIGGVLEPLQANPTIIEDNCFIGARSEVVEGVIVEENAVLGMGVFIGQSTKIFNRATGEVSYGRVPAGSVVVAGSLPSGEGRCQLYCAVIVKQVDAGTRAKTSINELLRA